MRGTVRLTWLIAVVAIVLPTLSTAGPAQADAARQGLTLLDDVVASDDGRLHDLTFASEALGFEVTVRVLLPASYDDASEATRRYPVLLLLHGASGNERAWTEFSDIEGHSADKDLIVVMPDGGRLGFYSDWIDGPQWETFHLDELLPWIESTYRAVGTREGRAVGGLSMGGFGAMAYPARHPDRFLAAASFSGAVNIADLGIAEATALKALGLGDDRLWGPFLTHEANWRGHNPPDLASNLRWTSLHLTTGNGVPCAGDRIEGSFLEVGTFAMATGFLLRLGFVGITPDFVDLRPCGTHEGHYWDRDVARWLPELMARFADPAPRPVAFDFRTTEPATSVWGWSFTAHRPAVEFLDLTAVSPAGLTATGSGPVDVVTAPAYEPGATYRIDGDRAGVVTVPVAIVPPLVTIPGGGVPPVTVVADATGRLAFTLDLGPAHTLDQYSPGALIAEAAGVASYFRSTTVTITQVAGAPVAAPTATPSVSTSTSDIRGGMLPATGGPSPLWPIVGAAILASLALQRLRRSTSPTRTHH